MMKNIFLLLFFCPFLIKAQNNLIENGDFEKYQNRRFTYWHFDTTLSVEKVLMLIMEITQLKFMLMEVLFVLLKMLNTMLLMLKKEQNILFLIG